MVHKAYMQLVQDSTAHCSSMAYPRWKINVAWWIPAIMQPDTSQHRPIQYSIGHACFMNIPCQQQQDSSSCQALMSSTANRPPHCLEGSGCQAAMRGPALQTLIAQDHCMQDKKTMIVYCELLTVCCASPYVSQSQSSSHAKPRTLHEIIHYHSPEGVLSFYI